ncbi:MAG TPA: formate dehydrogenase accessory sulfurtransferase FdhD [Steroidobacteraceae bacterium]|nr:formate dehydrogenase accessory sulfurtransferase FdhD [Steroidobacteraceae bacterium]
MSRPPEPEVISRAAPTASGTEVTVDRWLKGTTSRATDEVAEEAPIALTYHGVPHVVMLATPADLEDLAYGFTLSEELVASPEEIQSVEVAAVAESAVAESDAAAYEVRIGIAWERFPELLRRRRNLTGRTGCGLCGTETLEAAVRGRSRVGAGPRVTPADLHSAIVQLESLQPLNARTGSVHAAAWVVPGQGIQLVREDVGRHNALDKAIGALVRAGAALDAGYMLVTSRASYEMVQKAATVGIAFLAALSAPTGFAVRHAERSGLTLVAFARRDRHVVYTHPDRLA